MKTLTLILAFTLTLPATAAAHTPDEIDAWLTEWAAAWPHAGLTVEHAETFVDFAERHPHHFHPPTRRADPPDTRRPRAPATHTSVEAWRTLVTAHFPPAEVDRALCIMHHESRGDPNATNPSSGAAGLFQHLPRYWPERSTAAGLPDADIYNPTANTAVAAWLQGRDGWRHWAPWQRGLCR